MPHSPNGRNLRAADGAVLPDSPVDLICATSIDGHRRASAGAMMVLYKLTPPDTYCCAFAP
jgi:hypothetical protein